MKLEVAMIGLGLLGTAMPAFEPFVVAMSEDLHSEVKIPQNRKMIVS